MACAAVSAAAAACSAAAKSACVLSLPAQAKRSTVQGNKAAYQQLLDEARKSAALAVAGVAARAQRLVQRRAGGVRPACTPLRLCSQVCSVQAARLQARARIQRGIVGAAKDERLDVRAPRAFHVGLRTQHRLCSKQLLCSGIAARVLLRQSRSLATHGRSAGALQLCLLQPRQLARSSSAVRHPRRRQQRARPWQLHAAPRLPVCAALCSGFSRSAWSKCVTACCSGA